MKQKNSMVEREGMTVAEMGEYLGISYSFAHQLSHTPGFPCVRIGGRRIILKSLLLKWLEAQISDGKPIGFRGKMDNDVDGLRNLINSETGGGQA